MSGPGKLFLLPVALSDSPQGINHLPQSTLQQFHALEYFIVEKAKSARQFLKRIHHPRPINTLHLSELNEHTSEQEWSELLNPIKEGFSVGLFSEAGCPAVADPGAQLVRLAHQSQISVVPLTGPSALLLALMASGLNGQHFTFHGYVPAPTIAREQRLLDLECRSKQQQETQILIETPYRNQALFDSLTKVLKPFTWLSIAYDLTGQNEWIKTMTVKQWRQTEKPDITQKPCMFLFLA
jgi:16S rRNA (cytidine1402-2'-O)-methyltransferase